MASFVPRTPYSQEEINELYPQDLQLQLVQVLLRHGERSPVSPRFMNAGLAPHWPYCGSARHLTSAIMTTSDFSQWDGLKYRRRLETFGPDDGPIIASGPAGEFDAICRPGELTDKGRATTLALGQRLRHLYVDQLGFMPKLIASSDMIYLRATPIPRALESVQQTFWGFYPPNARTADFPAPTIITRSPADETLFPNDSNCRRLAQLTRAFAQRAADRWNDTDDMKYLTKLLGKWMPESSPVIAVDSKPRLSGILDTVNATRAHGPATKLPKEFYDDKADLIIDKISVEEWYQGYTDSREYRMLGIGALMGDIVSRMTGSIERTGADGLVEVGGDDGKLGRGRGGEQNIKLALSGCHDTTLSAVLHSLGAFGNERWPPYTSHIAIEMFKKRTPNAAGHITVIPALENEVKPQSWWKGIFGNAKITQKPEGIARKSMDTLTVDERQKLEGYYVRLRYNDKIMRVPGCKEAGKHLDGDESFCTLEAFKSIVDKFTPQNWHAACSSNMDQSPFPQTEETAGF
ncbi:phosphoglycerate mutase-like protein [Tothia fuscella]|uniref:3-phytase n=1 Tax=Tothia fuscella TaxID=1048955 RepID=A0A9P4NRI2_9PEZI|nr:phosphoglycerate mutase-like protein [Tothia fuscella]